MSETKSRTRYAKPLPEILSRRIGRCWEWWIVGVSPPTHTLLVQGPVKFSSPKGWTSCNRNSNGLGCNISDEGRYHTTTLQYNSVVTVSDIRMWNGFSWICDLRLFVRTTLSVSGCCIYIGSCFPLVSVIIDTETMQDAGVNRCHRDANHYHVRRSYNLPKSRSKLINGSI